MGSLRMPTPSNFTLSRSPVERAIYDPLRFLRITASSRVGALHIERGFFLLKWSNQRPGSSCGMAAGGLSCTAEMNVTR
jgi:hypothetical protein